MWGGSSAACASVDARGIHREGALYVVRRRGGREDASPSVAAKTKIIYSTYHLQYHDTAETKASGSSKERSLPRASSRARRGNAPRVRSGSG